MGVLDINEEKLGALSDIVEKIDKINKEINYQGKKNAATKVRDAYGWC